MLPIFHLVQHGLRSYSKLFWLVDLVGNFYDILLVLLAFQFDRKILRIGLPRVNFAFMVYFDYNLLLTELTFQIGDERPQLNWYLSVTSILELLFLLLASSIRRSVAGKSFFVARIGLLRPQLNSNWGNGCNFLKFFFGWARFEIRSFGSFELIFTFQSGSWFPQRILFGGLLIVSKWSF